MANWLRRAKREILKTGTRGTVNTAKNTLSSVLAVPHPGIFEKTQFDGSGERSAVKSKGLTAEEVLEIDAGNISAVLIDSTVLGAEIWFALRDDWKPDPDDNRAVLYAHELPLLRAKTPEQLRKIHETKRAFGPGTRVRK